MQGHHAPPSRKLGNLSRGLLLWVAPLLFFPLSTAKAGMSGALIDGMQTSLAINPFPWLVLVLVSLTSSIAEYFFKTNSSVFLLQVAVELLLLGYFVSRDEAFFFDPASAGLAHAAGAKRGASFLEARGKMSVVLPCLNETFVVQTVRSFCERTPTEILGEILIVDDGSTPSVSQTLTSANLKGHCPWRILRHEKPRGLMNAKQTGGDAAVGRYIGFFDCHVAPAIDWHKEIIQLLDQKPERLVVPMIGDLDLDTYDFVKDAAWKTKCYIDFNADFWWYEDESNFIPIISGGLVATSREWWRASGGFDSGMSGWGGENSDQSLRAWLCGGDVVRAPSSHIAHMWRVNSDKRTVSRYHLDSRVGDNLARVAAAWMGEFGKKYRAGIPAGINVSQTLAVKQRLGCKPYVYYLHRFRKIYRDAAVIPPRAFRIRAKGVDSCIENHGSAYALTSCERAGWFHLANLQQAGFPPDSGGPPQSSPLKPGSKQVKCGQHYAASCSECPQGHGAGWCNADCAWSWGTCLLKVDVAEQQRTLDKSRKRKCCSGIREYNTMNCLDALKNDGPIPYQCDVVGINTNQQYHFQPDGQIRHYSGQCLGATVGNTLTAVDCDLPSTTRWEQVEEFLPEEFTWYEESVKKYGLTEDLPDH